MFFITAILVAMKWYFIVVLIYIFLMNNDVEYFFHGLVFTIPSVFGEVCLDIFYILLLGSWFFLTTGWWDFFIFWMRVLDTWFASILFYFIVFYYFDSVFQRTEDLNLEIALINSFFYSCGFWCHVWEYLPNPGSPEVFSVFSSIWYIGLDFSFSLVICFD